MTALGDRSIAAVFWGGGGTVVRMMVQIGTQIVLARLLGPTEYGVFALGGIVVGFCGFFADFGLAYALIQKRELRDEDVRFAFSWQLLVGMAVTAAIALSAPALAAFFDEPRAASVIAALGSVCLINALAGVPLSLLKRKLDFKTQQLGFIVSYALGFVGIGIPMALMGHGVWALAAAWIAQAVVLLLIAYAATRHPLQPLWWYDEAQAQLRYGRTVAVTNVFNWAVANVDKVAIGHSLPSRDMGLYSTIYNLVYVPTASVLSVVQPVFFSASSRVAEGADETVARAKMAEAFAALLAVVCLYVLPVAMAAALLSDQIVLILYGPAWAAGSAVLAPACIAMPFFMAWGLSTPMLWASGAPQAEFGSQWHLGLLWAVSCWMLAHWGGIAAVAWGSVGLFLLRLFSILHAVTRHSAVNWPTVWRAVRGGLALSLLAAIGVGLARCAGELAELQPMPSLTLSVIAGLVSFCAALRCVPRLVAPEAVRLMGNVMARLPASIGPRLAWLYGGG